MKLSRTQILVAIWTLPSLVLLLSTWCTYSAFRIPPPDRLDDGERAAVIAPLRAVVDDPKAAVVAPAVTRDTGTIVVTVWLDGKPTARVEVTADDLSTATAEAAKRLAQSPGITKLAPVDRGHTRIQVDVVTGRGPIGGGSPLYDNLVVPGVEEMLAISPGIDGIGGTINDKSVMLLPNELVSAKTLQTKVPSAAMSDFAIGIDLKKIGSLIAQRAGERGVVEPDNLYRFRTDEFVEPPVNDRGGRAPIPLTRGIPPRPELNAAALREAALNGGRYLVAHLAPNGRYVYEHDLSSGVMTDPKRTGSAYSMPRHAGTTYFLAELYRITKENWLKEPIERAIHHLADLVTQNQCGTDEYACVRDKNEKDAQLGSTALAVVALAEYQRATGDKRFLDLATKLAAFLLFMQRDDGSFKHIYDSKLKKPDEDQQLLYYTGEATLALARMYVITGDEKYGEAAMKGLDWSVDWYDFFLGGFFYGEEHWTCITAEAIYAYPPARKDKYREFCDGYGTFLRAQQAGPGDFPDEQDLIGAYNMTPFVMPYNTPAGSRTEAMVSAYLLDLHHEQPDARIKGQIRDALAYVIGQQVRPDSDFNAVGPADGGMPGSPIDRNVRIDFVQHTNSAMIRASEFIDDPLQ